MAGEDQTEFDGTTVLCRVCGDKASGFHYGVHSCEGCKGFFRRSIQQKIQYRPCTKNQQCSILRINRNRCQYCRLKKCIAVGMSRDAVRFGRVPKREKAKILAAMQKVNACSQEKALGAELEDELRLLATVVRAHEDTCDYTRDKVAGLVERARSAQASFASPPPQLACPLNPAPHIMENGVSHYMEDFSERFAPAIKGVVEFAKRIPGFGFLSQDDQVTLLKAGVFEVLLVRLACMFDSQANSLICLNGQVLRRESLHTASNARFLLDSMFDFAERLNTLRLTDSEVGLFCAVVVIAADRPGLRNMDLVLKVQKKMMDILQKAVTANHPDNPSLFGELMKKIPDLRTLNTLHSEKLLAYKMEPRSSNPIEQQFAAAVQHDIWSQYAMAVGHDDMHPASPGQHSTTGSEWSTTDSKDDPVGSPHSSVGMCPERSYPAEEWSPQSHHHLSKTGSDHGSSSGDEGYYVESPVKASSVQSGYGRPIPKQLLRRVDSPTDSGIESGREHGTTPTVSVCSSPQSVDSDSAHPAVGTAHAQEGPIEDMPVLKRALQAPPIVTPNALMNEAYRHHKKFRALHSHSPPMMPDVSPPMLHGQARPHSHSPPMMPDAGPHSPNMLPMARPHSHSPPMMSDARHSPPMMPDTRPHSPPMLACTHSTLVRTLAQAPRYLNEQQLKRTDLIHSIIMQKEQPKHYSSQQRYGSWQQPRQQQQNFCPYTPSSPPLVTPSDQQSQTPQSSQPLNLSKKLFSPPPMLKMES